NSFVDCSISLLDRRNGRGWRLNDIAYRLCDRPVEGFYDLWLRLRQCHRGNDRIAIYLNTVVGIEERFEIFHVGAERLKIHVTEIVESCCGVAGTLQHHLLT